MLYTVSGGTVLGQLENNKTYFVKKVGVNSVRLSTTYDGDNIVNEIKYEQNKIIISSNFDNESYHGISDKIDTAHFRKTVVISASKLND